MLKKLAKRVLKTIFWILVAFVTLDLLIVILLFVPPVQQYAVMQVSKILTNITGGEITVDKIYLSPSLVLTAKNLAIKDHHLNNMIFASSLKGRINLAKTAKGQVCLAFAKLEEGEVMLRKYAGEDKVNIAIWAQGFKKEEKKEPKFKLLFDNIELKEVRFVFINDDKRKYPNDNTIDYAFFELQHIHLNVDDFLVFGPDISCKIRSLTLSQHTGFEISSFAGNFRIFSQGLRLDDLHFETPNSVFKGDFAFKYNDFPDFSDFVNNIHFDTKVKCASLSMKDFVLFVPKLQGMDNQFIFSGYVGGTVNHLQTKDIYLKYKLQTHIAGNFEVENILDMKNSHFNLFFKDITLNFSELAQLKLPKGKTIPIPEVTQKLTFTRLRGSYRGSLKKFNTNLVVQTNLGTVETTIKTTFKRDSLTFLGTLACHDFDLGKFIDQPRYFNKANLKSSLTGNAKNTNNLKDLFTSLFLQLQGSITQIDLCDYPLRNVDLNASYKQKQATIALLSKDSLASFCINGKLDLSNELPCLSASLGHIKIKLHEYFSHYQHHIDTTAKGFDKLIYKVQQMPNLNFTVDTITIALNGNRFENIYGYIGIDYAKLTNGVKTSRIDWFRFNAINFPHLPHQYQIRTNAVNVTFKTNYELKDCIAAFKNAIQYHLPEMFEKEFVPKNEITSTDSLQFIDIDVQLFYTQNLTNLLIPNLNISRNTSAFIHIGKTRSEDSLNLSISQVSYANLGKINNLNLIGKMNNKEMLELKLKSDSISIFRKGSNLTFSDININTLSNKQNIQYKTAWRNPKTISINELNQFNGRFYKDTTQNFTLKVTDSKLFIRNSLWKFTGEENLISFGKKGYTFDHCVLSSDIGKLSIHGDISKYSNTECTVMMENIDISMLNSVTSKKRMTFDGEMSLSATIKSDLDRFILEGKTFVKKFTFNDEVFGDLFLDATVLSDNNLYFFGGIMQNDEVSNLDFLRFTYADYLMSPNKSTSLSGKFFTKNKELRVNAKIDSLQIGFLSPFLSSFSNVVTGNISGNLDFIMVPDSLYFDGKVNIRNAQLGITPLNTIYNITNQEILFDRKGIIFNQVALTDNFKNKATLSGFVHHNLFKDITIDLDISTSKILAINTPRKLDAPFFGSGFVSGDISIRGDSKLLTFSSHNIRTLPGSIITFPLSSASTVSSSKGIYFVESANRTTTVVKDSATSTAMNFDFVFDITRDVDVLLELEPIDGVLRCKTAGRLHFTYNSIFKTMNLEGLLAIVNGKFHMSLKNLFPRDFAIVEGGTIAFSGPITSAQVNVSALYQKAASLSSLSPLLNNIGRTDVSAILGLTGNLMNPTPTFTFDFPRLTAENQINVFTALDTANQQNGVRQFFSFVFLNTFISIETNFNATQQSLGTGIDFVSGILNSLISSKFNNLSIGVNFINDQESYKEYSVNAEMNFVNNRIKFKTNLGYAENSDNPTQKNNFVGDVNMEVNINELWKFRAFYFSDVTGDDALKPQQGGGVGLSFQQEFHNRKDFAESWVPKKKKNKNNKK